MCILSSKHWDHDQLNVQPALGRSNLLGLKLQASIYIYTAMDQKDKRYNQQITRTIQTTASPDTKSIAIFYYPKNNIENKKYRKKKKKKNKYYLPK